MFSFGGTKEAETNDGIGSKKSKNSDTYSPIGSVTNTNSFFGQTGAFSFSSGTPEAKTNAFSGFTFTIPKATTAFVKFNPPTGQDTILKGVVSQNVNTKHMCIVSMKEYDGLSLEELRFEWYNEKNTDGAVKQFGATNGNSGFPVAGINTCRSCPMCTKPIQRVKVLCCNHFCCETCFSNMVLAKVDTNAEYLCPLCGGRSGYWGLESIPVFSDISEKRERNHLCSMCKFNSAAWICSDCSPSTTCCLSCRPVHDSKLFNLSHVMQALNITETLSQKDENPVFCQLHPQNRADIQCKECNKLICSQCCVTKHKGHETETVEEALGKVIPELRQNKTKAESVIATTQAALNEATRDLTKMKQEYRNVEMEIREKYEEALKKLWKDYNQAQQDLKSFEADHSSEITKRVNHLQFNLLGQQNAIDWADNALRSTKGVHLLYTIQSGLKTSIDTVADQKQEFVPCISNIYPKFIPAIQEDKSVIGRIERKEENKLLSNRGLGDLKAVLTSQFSLNFYSFRFAKIRKQLWFTVNDSNVVHIYSLVIPGLLIRTTTLPNIEYARSVTSVGDEIALAASNGFFLVAHKESDVSEIPSGHFAEGGDTNPSEQEVVLRKILDGNFSDICYSDGKIYLLNNGAHKVQVIESEARTKNDLLPQKEIEILEYVPNYRNTVQATGNGIFVAIWDNHKILQYNNDGKLVMTYGGIGTVPTGLLHPLLCGITTENGEVVIADCHHHRLKLLGLNGEFQELNIKGLGQYPVCAKVTDDALYVLLVSKILQRFSLK